MAVAAPNKTTHRSFGEAIDIFFGRKQVKHTLCVETVRERELDEDAVNVGVVGQLRDRGFEISLANVCRKLDMARNHAGLVRLLALVSHIDLAWLVVADEHGGQTDVGVAERSDALMESGHDLVTQTITVHQDCTAGRAFVVAGRVRVVCSHGRKPSACVRLAGGLRCILMNGPLHGYRILDLSQVVAGPLATQMLAEQGADVLKIEPPGGELLRLHGPDHVMSLHANCNRGKRCLAVDLSNQEGTDLMLQLAATCDVFVENFRPGVTERLGLGYEAVRAANPDIVYCSVYGFGSTGPYCDRAVLDPVIQAITGMVAGQASPALPFPDLIRTLVADKSTAYTVAQAITAALLARERGAGGQFIEVPMLDATLAWYWPDGFSDLTQEDPTIAPRRAPDNYQLIETVDGRVVYYVATDKQVQGMWRVLGRDDLLADPNFNKISAIGKDPKLAIAMGEAIHVGIAAMKTADVIERMAAEGIPCGPVLERADVMSDPQVVHNDIVVEWNHPTAGPLRQPRPAARFSKTPGEFRAQIGVTGEHTDEILGELGYDDAQIAMLRGAGTVA
jgi:crotonobetainyl-CoA:carnitine CoA-transferase CaiB-like acyl-CoA transferase